MWLDISKCVLLLVRQVNFKCTHSRTNESKLASVSFGAWQLFRTETIDNTASIDEGKPLL